MQLQISLKPDTMIFFFNFAGRQLNFLIEMKIILKKYLKLDIKKGFNLVYIK